MNSYDLIARFYEQIIDDVLYALYLELVPRYVLPSEGLEVGCGTAALSRELTKRGYRMTAMDTSEAMLDVAAYYAGVENLDITFLNHAMDREIPEKFSLIMMPTDVVNHIPNEAALNQLAKNLYQALKNDGILIFDYLHCDFLQKLIGYHETIHIDHADLGWKVLKGKEPCSVIHRLSYDNIEAEHNEYWYSKETLEDVFSLFKWCETITLEERTVCILKKEK